MLTRLYIDNFLCFVNFEYLPATKQLILGANGTGKLLLTAIRNLKQFITGGTNQFHTAIQNALARSTSNGI
jgi:AAA15 family ATPase/GTPase